MEQTVKQQSAPTLDLALIAAGAALIAVCSWISIPMTVPFTMQTFAVFFVLMLLGGKRGTVSVAVYLLLGAVGVPVFAQFTGGPAILFGSTGGFLLGFLAIGLIFRAAELIGGNRLPLQAAALVLGLAVCYAFGTLWFQHLYTKANGAVSIGTVLSWCVFPFILPDLVKMALAVLLAKRVSAALHWNK